MNIKTRFRVSRRELSSVAFRLVRLVLPFGVRVDDVCVDSKSDETLKVLRIAFAIAVCRAAGLKWSRLGEPKAYGLIKLRDYEPKDLDSCDFLFVHDLPGREVETFKEPFRRDASGRPILRDSQGRLIILSQNLFRLKDFGLVNHHIVVSPETRSILEQRKFSGPCFREVVIHPVTKIPVYPRCWELTTTITMPKLANTDRLKCYGTGASGKVEAFTGDYTRMVFIDDPPFATGEPHYRRSDLERLGFVDVAETLEHLWIPQRSLVISQRFYQYLLELKVPMNVQPIRVDAE